MIYSITPGRLQVICPVGQGCQVCDTHITQDHGFRQLDPISLAPGPGETRCCTWKPTARH